MNILVPFGHIFAPRGHRASWFAKILAVHRVIFSVLVIGRFVDATNGLNSTEMQRRETQLHSLIDSRMLDGRDVPPSLPTNVSLGLHFLSLHSVDVVSGQIELGLWRRMRWSDQRISWDTSADSEFEHVGAIVKDPKDVWVPDALLYNSAEKISADLSEDVKIWYSPDGTGYWSVPGKVNFVCDSPGEPGERPYDSDLAASLGRKWPAKIDLTLFPFDTQYCELKFGGWNEGGKRMNLKLMDPGPDGHSTPPIDGLLSSNSWKATVAGAEVRNMYYLCCPGQPWPQAYYYIVLSRAYTDHIVNIFLPVMLAVCCGFLGFWLPPHSGERIGLGVTCLLTIFAVMFITNDSLPKTKNFTLLSLFYLFSLLFTLLTLMTSAVVISLHANGDRIRLIQSDWYSVLDTLWTATAKAASHEPFEKVFTKKSATDSVKEKRDISDLTKGRWPSCEELAAIIDAVGRGTIPSSYLAFILLMVCAATTKNPDIISIGSLLAFAVALVFGILTIFIFTLLRYKFQIASQESLYSRQGVVNTNLNHFELLKYRQDFMRFDKDKSGNIEVGELVEAMKSSGHDLGNEDARRCIGLADCDNDKSISFSEYVNLFEAAKLRQQFTYSDTQNRCANAAILFGCWDADRVSKWLVHKGFSELVSTFERNHVDGAILVGLTEMQLRDDLGIASIGKRRQILNAIDSLIHEEIALKLRKGHDLNEDVDLSHSSINISET